MKNKKLLTEEINKMKHLMNYKLGAPRLNEDDTVLGTSKVVGLSQISPELANDVIGGGLEDGSRKEDVVLGKKTSFPVGKLRPAQTEIIKEKAFGIAIQSLLENTWKNADLGNIVSNDSNPYIMDGHHRWAAISLISPKANVMVTQIDLPGKALVTTLNLFTVGKLGITKGNKGKGNVEEFTGANFNEIIDNALTNGTTGWDNEKKAKKTISPEEVKKALGMIPGANGNPETGKQIMMKNADILPKEKMPGAPARVEMPVINSDKVDLVKKYLEKGVIDIKQPYSGEVKQELGQGGGE